MSAETKAFGLYLLAIALAFVGGAVAMYLGVLWYGGCSI